MRQQCNHEQPHFMRPDIALMDDKECPKCDGSGKWQGNTCQVCQGSGKVKAATTEQGKALKRRNKKKGQR